MKSRSGTRCGRWALAPTLLATLMLALPVAAQPGAEDPEIVWREGEVAPPPAWSTARMVRIDMPIYSEVMVGVDVDSVTVGGKDGVVRYVAVVQGRGGAGSAYYQGVHCKSFQGRTYARYRFDRDPPGWENVDEAWQDLKDMKSRTARAIAQAGACENFVPAASTVQARRAYARNPKWSGAAFEGRAAPVPVAGSAAPQPVRP